MARRSCPGRAAAVLVLVEGAPKGGMEGVPGLRLAEAAELVSTSNGATEPGEHAGLLFAAEEQPRLVQAWPRLK